MNPAFDPLAYNEKLVAAGFAEEQARVQANAFRDFTSCQEENLRRELATKGDLRETEARLQKKMREIELRLLKWQFGIAFALAAIMAKGFDWLAF